MLNLCPAKLTSFLSVQSSVKTETECQGGSQHPGSTFLSFYNGQSTENTENLKIIY